jgi:pectate lyase
MSQSLTFKPRLLASLGALLGALACSGSDSPDAVPPGSTRPVGNGGSASQPTGSAGAGGSGSGVAGAGTTPVARGGATNEGNVTPVGLSGAAGQLGAGGSGSQSPATGGSSNSAGAGGAVATAGTGNVPADCDVLPPASPLEGWAAVAGRGVETTTGGGALQPTVVTTLAQLQDAAAGVDPRVILVRGELEPGDVAIGSNKTIVGTCGAEVHGHLEIREATNIIIRNLTIVGYGEGDCTLDPGFDPTVGCSSGDDAVSVQRNTHHVWFDHCSVRDGTDGNLDVSNAADFVTISWTKFSYTPRTDDVGDDSTGPAGHRYSNLVGGTDAPTAFDDANALNVTWHHNWWADNVVERQPRIRFGKNHLYNNYYNSDVANYCVRAGIQAQVLLEGNFFDGVDDPHEFNNAADQLTANITADASNTYLNTTSDQATGGGGPAFTEAPYQYTLDESAGIPAAVTLGAGPH